MWIWQKEKLDERNGSTKYCAHIWIKTKFIFVNCYFMTVALPWKVHIVRWFETYLFPFVLYVIWYIRTNVFGRTAVIMFVCVCACIKIYLLIASDLVSNGQSKAKHTHIHTRWAHNILFKTQNNNDNEDVEKDGEEKSTHHNKRRPIHWVFSYWCLFARRTPEQQKSIYSEMKQIKFVKKAHSQMRHTTHVHCLWI